MDCSPPGSSVLGIFQARVLEWVAIAFSDIYIYISLKHIKQNQAGLKGKIEKSLYLYRYFTSYTVGGNANEYSHYG